MNSPLSSIQARPHSHSEHLLDSECACSSLCVGYSQAAYRKETSFLNDALYSSCTDMSTHLDDQRIQWSHGECCGDVEPKFDPSQMMPRHLADAYTGLVGLDETAIDPLQANPSVFSTNPGVASESRRQAGYSQDAPVMMPVLNKTVSDNTLMDPVAFIPPRTIPKSLPYGTPDQFSNSSSCILPWNACPNQTELGPMLTYPHADAGKMDSVFRNDLWEEEMRATNYKSLLKLTSFSIKVFDCIPGNLPLNLRHELLRAVR